MKQATNQFTKGLITDYDPLNCPNDILTDNLNGTIITMNGSEMVLQNDMGNSKVYYGKDNEGNDIPVKLNDGFIPVGIKEYGGIIYIASYNPKTNKSEIGSFPSPEYEKLSEDNIKDFEISNYFENSCNSQVLIELFNGKKVYPGDTIRFDINGGDFNDITKYGSLKKDKYELKILVEDASHNLIDITDQFEIDDNGVLANNFENVYQNKFSGKLYFGLNRSTINRIESNLKIKFSSNNNGDKLDLIFIIDYYYNCPDFNEDEEYGTNEFPQNISGLDSFELEDDSYSSIRKIKQHENSKYPNNFLIVNDSDFQYELQFPMSMKVGDDFYYPEYIESEKLFKYRVSYTVPVTKQSEDTVIITLDQTDNSTTKPDGVTYTTDGVIYGCYLTFKQQSDNIFKYEITPVLNSKCVLSNLKNVGLINFNLIGTNTIELEKWQYYVTNEYTEITTKFQEYLDSDTECINRKLFILPYLEAKALEEDSTNDRLTNLQNNYSPYIININTSDQNTIRIYDLSFGNVYYCFIYYELNNGDTKYLGGRWLLNTMYFNNNIENDYQELIETPIPIKCKFDIDYYSDTSDFQIYKTYILNDNIEEVSNEPICQYEDYKRIEYSQKYSNIHIKSFNIDYNNYPSSVQEPQDYQIKFNDIPVENGESIVHPSIIIKGIEQQSKQVTVTNVFENIYPILSNYWNNIDEDTVIFDTAGTTVHNLDIDDYNNQADYHNPDKLNILVNLDLSHISNNIFTAKITHEGSTQLETPIRFLCIKNGNNQNNNSCLVLNYVDDNDDSDLNFKHVLVYNPNAQKQITQQLQVYKNYSSEQENNIINVKCVINDSNIVYTVGNDKLEFEYTTDDEIIKTNLSNIKTSLYNSLTNYTEATGYIDELNHIQVFNTAVDKENNYILEDGDVTQSPYAYFKYYDNKLLGNNYAPIKGDTNKFFISVDKIYPFIDAKDICSNSSDFTKISV